MCSQTLLMEIDCSFPSSKAEQLCNAFVFGVQNCEWEYFSKVTNIQKNQTKLWKKHGNKKLVYPERSCSVDKERFKHILNIFKQRPSWCPLIHPSSSTFCLGSCAIEYPSRMEGHKHFFSVLHSWGTRDSPRLTAIFNLPCKYNNIFIKVLQGHPGTNQTTTKGNVSGP